MFVDKDGRIFIHHEFWECWKNGLYGTRKKDENKIHASYEVLSSVDNCNTAFSSVLTAWPYSSKVYLSNKSINRQAWLGQAACCVNHGANEDETKIAWFKLTKEEQDRANQIADYYIRKFEIEVMKDAEEKIRNRRFNRCERTYNMDLR